MSTAATFTPAAPPGAVAGDRAFFGHPRGLGILAFTEGWIGFSFYGMQSLLVLYMTGRLLRPDHVGHVWGFAGFRSALGLLYGPLSGQALASAVMGLYSALIYATPLLGALLADRLLGQTRTILIGVVLMTIGHFLMAFDASFLVALACLIAGAGCARNVAAQVGALYPPADPRRADAYQIYTMSVAVAVILSPLVCGTLGENVGWHWGFAAAGAGMLIGLVVYLAGRRWLPPEPPPRSRQGLPRPRLGASEWRRLAVLGLLLPLVALASIGNMQIFNAYLVWGKQNYGLVFLGRTMPVTWLLSLDAFISTFMLFGSILFWRWIARLGHSPGELVKMAIGAGVLALAPLILAAASFRASGDHAVGLAWGLAFHLVDDIGFANLYAVGLALYSRVAPPGFGALVVNTYLLHLFLANLLVGWLGGLLSRMPATQFWLLHAGLIAVAAVALAGCAVLFRRTLDSPAPA